MSTAVPLFQQYQLQFARHVRNPSHHPLPAGVPAKRMRVYNEIVFNNLLSAVGACFPVTKSVLGKQAWQKLVRAFFAQHQCQSPLFRQIPEEFLRYLETLDEAMLPPYLKSLAHYEWVELALTVANADADFSKIDCAGDLLKGMPVLAPALVLLNYDYPVQRISRNNKPSEAEPVNLLVFRDMQDEVRFIEINTVTARLLGLLQAEAVTGFDALHRIAAEMNHPDPQAVVRFGQEILEDLRKEGAILGIAVEQD